MKPLAEWLDAEMTARNVGLRRLGRLAGVAPTTIRLWRLGTSTPTWENCGALAEALDVDPALVRRLSGYAEDSGLSAQTPLAEDHYNRDASQAKDGVPPDDEAWRLDVPIITTAQFAAAGSDEDALHEHVDPTLSRDAGHKLQMHVRGDSLEGVLLDGDWIIFDLDQPWPPSGIVVAELDGKVYVKYGRRLANETYALYERPNRDRIEGMPTRAYRVTQIRRDV